MNDYGTVELALGVRRQAVLQRVLPGLAVAAALMYWSYSRGAHPFTLGFIFLIFASGLYIPGRLLLVRDAVLVTSRGLVDRTSGLGFIAWEEIRGATLYPFMGRTLVALNLTDTQSVVARLPTLQRWALRFYLKSPGTTPTLAAPFVEGGPEALLRVINEHARGAREAV